MKQLLLLAFFLFFISSQMEAQICEPDQMYADSAFGIYPPPYDPVTMTGGIDESACINQPYSFQLTFKIPETIDIPSPPVTATVESIEVVGLIGAPEGLTYACNPPDCVFTPDDVLGCLVIYGTATDANAPGPYELTLEGTVYNNVIDVSFDQLFTLLGTDNYEMTLEEEGSGTCFTSVEEALNDNMTIKTAPNPFSAFTYVTIKSELAETLQFRVVNLLGELVHAEQIAVTSGDNVIEFDGSQLANGVYQFSFSNGADALTQKVVLQK